MYNKQIKLKDSRDSNKKDPTRIRIPCWSRGGEAAMAGQSGVLILLPPFPL